LANEWAAQRHAVDERLTPAVHLVWPINKRQGWQDGIGGKQIIRVGEETARRDKVDKPSEAVGVDVPSYEDALLVPSLRVLVFNRHRCKRITTNPSSHTVRLSGIWGREAVEPISVSQECF
jgi:hypothetical protein